MTIIQLKSAVSPVGLLCEAFVDPYEQLGALRRARAAGRSPLHGHFMVFSMRPMAGRNHSCRTHGCKVCV